MAITIVTRASKGSALNATEFDANLTNLAAAIENLTTGHDHDGTDSKVIDAANIVNTPAGSIEAVTVQAAIDELDSEKLAATITESISITNTQEDTNFASLQVAAVAPIVNDVTKYVKGQQIMLTGSYVANGKTNSGYFYGLESCAFISSANHQGTLALQHGLYGRAGITNCGVGGTVTTSYGVYAEILNSHANGTITTGFGIYSNVSGAVGTMTNRYGVFVNAMGGAGTIACGIGIGSLTGTQTTKYGISIGTISGASTNNYGLKLADVSGATNNYSIYTGSGDVRFGGMVDLVSGRVKFPASQNASSNANTLDDYEEGTFTLYASDAVTEAGTGSYTKIGDIVQYEIYISVTGLSTSSLIGIPFAHNGYRGLYWSSVQGCNAMDSNGVPCKVQFMSNMIVFKTNTTDNTSFTLTTLSSGNIRGLIIGISKVA